MNPLFFAILVFSLGAFIRFGLRLWTGNLRRGDGERSPLGLGAFLGFAAGTAYLTGYMLRWKPEGGWPIHHHWARKVLADMEDYLEWVDLWTADYFNYAYLMTYWAAEAFEWWPIMPKQLLPIVVGLVALWVASIAWRMLRGKFTPGFFQDLGTGFFASLGVAPFLAVAFGVGYALLLLLCLLLLGMYRQRVGDLVTRS